MRKQIFYKFSAALVLMTLLACASAPMATPERDQKAKTFAVVPSKATVYLYRNETLGAALSMDVTVNGQKIGQTVSKSYFRIELEPGTYKIVSQGDDAKALELKAEAEKVYFVWQEVKMGFASGGSKLQVVPSEKGQPGVLECALLDGPATLTK
jgi:hypothetical protein